MKRSYYKKLNSPPIARRPSETESLQTLRDRILNIILQGIVFVGAAVIIYFLILAARERNWGNVIAFLPVYLLLVIAAYAKKLPYRIRAMILILSAYGLGVSAALQQGTLGNTRMWLVAFSSLAAILLGVNAGIGALAISAITLLGIGFLMSQGLVALPSSTQVPLHSDFTSWASSALILFLVAGAIMVGLLVVVQGLTSAQEREKSLTNLLSGEREQLGRKMNELDRRLLQLRTLAEITKKFQAQSDPEMLFHQLAGMLQDRFSLYFAGIYLLEETSQDVVLRAATGEVGKKMIQAGYRISIDGGSAVGWAMQNRRSRVSHDVSHEPMRFENPYLPLTRSEAVLPLVYGEHLFGALSLHSNTPRAFDPDDVSAMQSIADFLAVTLHAARLYQQVEMNLREIHSLNRQYTIQSWREIARRPEARAYEYEKDAGQSQAEGGNRIILPLALRDQVIGQITLLSDRDELAADELSFVEQVTTQAALALENIRLLEESHLRVGQERLVADLVQKARGSTDLESILRTTVGELGRVFSASEAVIRVEAGNGQEPELVTAKLD